VVDPAGLEPTTDAV